MKLLVDECLSDELTKLAQRRGHAEASHIAWVGKRGWKDWELKAVILDGDWTFVTKNSIDFRGPDDAPGSRGQYADVAVSAGMKFDLQAAHGFDVVSPPILRADDSEPFRGALLGYGPCQLRTRTVSRLHHLPCAGIRR